MIFGTTKDAILCKERNKEAMALPEIPAIVGF